MLTLVECQHYWLAVHYGEEVTAICKFYGCRKTRRFSRDEWQAIKGLGRALDKPVRL
jgi:hypothetical protein